MDIEIVDVDCRIFKVPFRSPRVLPSPHIDDRNSRIRELEKTVASQKSNKEKLGKELADSSNAYRRQLDERNRVIDQAASALKERNSVINGLHQNVARMQRNNEDRDRTLKELNDVRASLHTESQSLKAYHAVFGTLAAAVKQANLGVGGNISDENAVQKGIDSLKYLKTSHDDLVSQLADARRVYADLSNAHAAIQNKYKDLVDSLAEMRRLHDDGDQEKTQLVKHVADLQTSLQRSESNLMLVRDQTASEIRRLTDELHKTREDIVKQSKQFEQQSGIEKGVVDKLRSDLEVARRDLSAKAQEVAMLQMKHDDLQDRLQKQQTRFPILSLHDKLLYNITHHVAENKQASFGDLVLRRRHGLDRPAGHEAALKKDLGELYEYLKRHRATLTFPDAVADLASAIGIKS